MLEGAGSPDKVNVNAAFTHNSLQPIALLPSEILCDIFEYIVENNYSESTLNSPNVLACVCSVWRAAALNHSRLWCAVDLDWAQEAFEAWSDRSRDLPLAVKHFSVGDSVDYVERQAKHLLKTGSLDVWVCARDDHLGSRIGKILNRLACVTYRSLESVIAHNAYAPPDEGEEEDEDPQAPYFPNALIPSSLRSLALSGIRLNNPPVSNLRILSISRVAFTYAGFWSIVVSCPVLENLSLRHVSIEDEEMDGHWPLKAIGSPILLSLKTLSLATVPTPIFVFFTHKLPLSNLLKLSICSLERIRIIGPLLRAADQIESLEYMVRGGPEYRRSVLHAVSHHTKLRNLSMNCDPRNFGKDEDVIRQFVVDRLAQFRIRAAGGKALDTLSLNNCKRDKEAWFREHVQRLVYEELY